MGLKKYIFVVWLMLLCASSAFAQTETQRKIDSIRQRFKEDSLRVVAAKKEEAQGLKFGEPTRVALLSAALPGAGQFKNKKWWFVKIPAIYGGLGFISYAVITNHREYIKVRDALLYIEDNNPITTPAPPYNSSVYNPTNLRARRDRFRRDRDYSIILGVGIYFLQIAEAAATSHLKSFDVSDDLSMRIKPTLFLTPFGEATAGISVRLTLK